MFTPEDERDELERELGQARQDYERALIGTDRKRQRVRELERELGRLRQQEATEC